MKRTMTALATIALLGGFASGANATAINNLLGADPDQLQDQNAENIYTRDDMDNLTRFTGDLQPGFDASSSDLGPFYFAGVAAFDTLNGTQLGETGTPEVTGAFVVELQSVTTEDVFDGSTNNDLHGLTFGAADSSLFTDLFGVNSDDVAPGDAFLLFEDSTPDFNANDPFNGNAVDGDLKARGAFEDDDDFFIGAAPTDSNKFVGDDTPEGFFRLGLSFRQFDFGMLVGEVTAEQFFPNLGLKDSETDHDMVVNNGTLKSNTLDGDDGEGNVLASSDGTVSFRAIPVPGTVGFLGLGLLGLGVLARRRQQA